jgi:hypothetical protein
LENIPQPLLFFVGCVLLVLGAVLIYYLWLRR